jgi:hypothetical protein
MADKADKPKMVEVEAIKYHTNAGEAYDVGDTYDVDEAAVDNLAHLGMAIRVDRKAVAKAAKPTAKPRKKIRGRR